MYRAKGFVRSQRYVLVSILCAAAALHGENVKSPVEATVAQLAANPAKFNGRLVRVDALLVYGFEGDDFLSDPIRETQTPEHLWLYWKPEHEKDIAGAFPADRASVEAWFTGYFHFVPNHRPNSMFDPGSLQLEAIQALDPRPSQSLSAVIRRGDLVAAGKITRAGAKLNAIDEYELFPLWHASSLGYTDLVEDLLAAGANPNFTNPGEETALMIAAWNCKVGVVKVLIAHGAAVNLADGNGETALILSSQTCADGEITQILLDAKADPNAKASHRVTALMAAAGNPLVVQKLLKAGADPAAKSDSGDTAEGASCDRGAEGFYQVCQLVRRALGKPACEPGHCN